ncbi:hypothetical protein PQ478_21345 (plasmid) [Alkalihalophilus pseudofirmus]|uniref:hypothetical protein n=1 Tax=Alkalihalophilus pseudofirmus TaxID=79885 RepID=UPI00259BBB28|nr:hypothetical protein [Alkalihalophilus pseudofirmus]WEG19237.1 hypothetical protein PQ478_21345 [Alkalihalophilus pseudofirmus]
MKAELSIKSRNESLSIILYFLSIISAILSFLIESGSFLFAMLALVLISTSKVEASSNRFLKFIGILTYILYFSCVGYHVVMWIYTNFIT